MLRPRLPRLRREILPPPLPRRPTTPAVVPIPRAAEMPTPPTRSSSTELTSSAPSATACSTSRSRSPAGTHTVIHVCGVPQRRRAAARSAGRRSLTMSLLRGASTWLSPTSCTRPAAARSKNGSTRCGPLAPAAPRARTFASPSSSFRCLCSQTSQSNSTSSSRAMLPSSTAACLGLGDSRCRRVQANPKSGPLSRSFRPATRREVLTWSTAVVVDGTGRRVPPRWTPTPTACTTCTLPPSTTSPPTLPGTMLPCAPTTHPTRRPRSVSTCAAARAARAPSQARPTHCARHCSAFWVP